MNLTPETIGVIVVALVAAIPGILAWFGQRRKGKADTAEVIATAAGKLVESIQSAMEKSEQRTAEIVTELARAEVRIDILEKDNKILRETVKSCVVGINKLLSQLVEHQIVPKWEPIGLDVTLL